MTLGDSVNLDSHIQNPMTFTSRHAVFWKSCLLHKTTNKM